MILARRSNGNLWLIRDLASGLAECRLLFREADIPYAGTLIPVDSARAGSPVLERNLRNA